MRGLETSSSLNILESVPYARGVGQYSLKLEELRVILRKAFDVRVSLDIFLKPCLPGRGLIVGNNISNDHRSFPTNLIDAFRAESAELLEADDRYKLGNGV